MLCRPFRHERRERHARHIGDRRDIRQAVYRSQCKTPCDRTPAVCSSPSHPCRLCTGHHPGLHSLPYQLQSEHAADYVKARKNRPLHGMHNANELGVQFIFFYFTKRIKRVSLSSFNLLTLMALTIFRQKADKLKLTGIIQHKISHSQDSLSKTLTMEVKALHCPLSCY